VAGLHDLAREYEARRFPAARQLDLHGDGPRAARERALQWIQSFAHEEPGQEVLLIVERGQRPGRPATPVRQAVETLLDELGGRLIDWWQRFGHGSIAVRIAAEPTMRPLAPEEPPLPEGDGRTPETAGVGLLALHHDIPDELFDLAERAAELRRTREGVSVRLMDSVLRRVWIEAQAEAMEQRVSWEAALRRILEAERGRMLEHDE
jgi:hypothetical protein